MRSTDGASGLVTGVNINKAAHRKKVSRAEPRMGATCDQVVELTLRTGKEPRLGDNLDPPSRWRCADSASARTSLSAMRSFARHKMKPLNASIN